MPPLTGFGQRPPITPDAVRTPRHFWLRLGVLSGVAALHVGCSSAGNQKASGDFSTSAGSTSQDPRNFTDATVTPGDISAYSDAQVEALSDGKISHSEYRQGFERFAACVETLGFALIRSGERYGVIQYSIPVEALDNGADSKCYRREFFALDESWQLSHEDFGFTAQILNECLRGHGLPIPESFSDKLRKLEQSGIKVETCKG